MTGKQGGLDGGQGRKGWGRVGGEKRKVEDKRPCYRRALKKKVVFHSDSEDAEAQTAGANLRRVQSAFFPHYLCDAVHMIRVVLFT